MHKTIQHIAISPESINTPLKVDHLCHLLKLFSKFSDHITTGNSVAAVIIGELKITLKMDKIICYNPYRMPLREREKVNRYFWFPGMTKFLKKYYCCLKRIVGKKYTERK